MKKETLSILERWIEVNRKLTKEITARLGRGEDTDSLKKLIDIMDDVLIKVMKTPEREELYLASIDGVERELGECI